MNVMVLMDVNTLVIILLDLFTVPVTTDMSYNLMAQLVKVNMIVCTVAILPHIRIMMYSDINECQTDNGGCTQTCDNTDGSYQCSCWDGYELTEDGHTCTGM